MQSNLFRKLINTNRIFIACMLLLIILKVMLQRYQPFVFNRFSDVRPVLLLLFGASCINLFIFFLAALFSNQKREVWWKQEKRKNKSNELFLNIWTKSLMVSFVVYVIGTFGAVLFFGSIYMILLLLIVFIVQHYSRLVNKH